MTSMLGQTPKA